MREKTDLRSGIDLTEERSGEGIPESNFHIRRSTTARKNPMLMRIPRDSLDRSDMLRKAIHGRFAHFIPNEKLVVVPTTRELILLNVPLESAHFLSMTDELRDVLFSCSDVAMVDESIVRARSENRFVPGECSDARFVPSHRTDNALLFGVPDLNASGFRSDCEMRTLFVGQFHRDQPDTRCTDSLNPAETSDRICTALVGEIAEFRDFTRVRAPQIDAGTESDAENVRRGPVDEIEVVVVLLHSSASNLNEKGRIRTANSGASSTLNGTLLSCLGALRGLRRSFCDS